MAGKKINTKSELSKTDVKIVIIVVIFLLAIVIGAVEFLYIYKPNAEKIVETQQTLDGLQIRLDEAKKIPNQIAHYQREIDILEGKTTGEGEGEEGNTELRQELDLPKILSIVETSATASNMKLQSITMDGNAAYIKGGVIIPSTNDQNGEGDGVVEEQTATAFYKLGIAMDVTSVSYEGLMQFLETIEDAGYYATTSSASLTLNPEDNVYAGALNFYIYSFVSSSK